MARQKFNTDFFYIIRKKIKVHMHGNHQDIGVITKSMINMKNKLKRDDS